MNAEIDIAGKERIGQQIRVGIVEHRQTELALLGHVLRNGVLTYSGS